MVRRLVGRVVGVSTENQGAGQREAPIVRGGAGEGVEARGGRRGRGRGRGGGNTGAVRGGG